MGKLTDDDITVIEGKREQLVGKIQERYGYQKEAAEKKSKPGKNTASIVGSAMSR